MPVATVGLLTACCLDLKADSRRPGHLEEKMNETPVFDDPELEVMRKIGEALEGQDQGARDRILRWMTDRYGSDAVGAG